MFRTKKNSPQYPGWSQGNQSFGSSGSFGNNSDFQQNQQAFNGQTFQSSIPQYQGYDDIQKTSSVAFESAHYKKKPILLIIILCLLLLLLAFFLFKHFVLSDRNLTDLYNKDEFVIEPKIARTIPFTVVNDLNKSCYFYLDSDNDNADTAFLVDSGTSKEILAPEGTFTLYYATGTKWKNVKKKFGDTTEYYKDEEDYIIAKDKIWTVTVYSTFDSDTNIIQIRAEDFPN